MNRTGYRRAGIHVSMGLVQDRRRERSGGKEDVEPALFFPGSLSSLPIYSLHHPSQLIFFPAGIPPLQMCFFFILFLFLCQLICQSSIRLRSPDLTTVVAFISCHLPYFSDEHRANFLFLSSLDSRFFLCLWTRQV